jgi:hypothetical protein
MEGPRRGSLLSARLTRQAESSRLQLELVRRAFELLVPNPRRPIRQPQLVHRRQRSAAAAVDAEALGE